MSYVPPDHRLIQAHGRREEPGGPQHGSPVSPFQLGIPKSKLPTHIRFHLAHNTWDSIFRRNHQHHMNVVNLHTPLFDLPIRMIALDFRYMLLHKELDHSPQNASPILRNPHHMVLMLLRTMSTESNLHAPVSSNPLHMARRPRFQRGALSPTGSRHVVLRASFDREHALTARHKFLV